jgi:hypothetical protein
VAISALATAIVSAGHQQAGAVLRFGMDVHRQVAVGDGARDFACIFRLAAQLVPDGAHHEPGHHGQAQDHDQRGQDHGPQHAVHIRFAAGDAGLELCLGLHLGLLEVLVEGGEGALHLRHHGLGVALVDFEHDARGRQRRRIVIVEFLEQARAVVGLAGDGAELFQVGAHAVGLLAHLVDACLVAFADGGHQAVGDVLDFERERFRGIEHRVVGFFGGMDRLQGVVRDGRAHADAEAENQGRYDR